MKKIFITFLVAIITLSFTSPSFAQSSDNNNLEKGKADFTLKELKEMKKAFQDTELELIGDNLDKVEKKIYDDDGEYIGTMGMEVVEVVNDDLPLVTPYWSLPSKKKKLKNGTTTVKVFWNAVSVNYSFYAKIKKSGGKASIYSVYDESHFVIPPAVVKEDVLSIVKKTESTAGPAHAKYTLTMGTYIGGSVKLYIYVKAGKGSYWTGGN